MVQGAIDAGFKFVGKVNDTITISIRPSGNQLEQFTILAEFPFDSTRKRMSFIIKENSTNIIYLMTKGADNIMLPRTMLDLK